MLRRLLSLGTHACIESKWFTMYALSTDQSSAHFTSEPVSKYQAILLGDMKIA